jgi:hypothetical protein
LGGRRSSTCGQRYGQEDSSYRVVGFLVGGVGRPGAISVGVPMLEIRYPKPPSFRAYRLRAFRHEDRAIQRASARARRSTSNHRSITPLTSLMPIHTAIQVARLRNSAIHQGLARRSRLRDKFLVPQRFLTNQPENGVPEQMAVVPPVEPEGEFVQVGRQMLGGEYLADALPGRAPGVVVPDPGAAPQDARPSQRDPLTLGRRPELRLPPVALSVDR